MSIKSSLSQAGCEVSSKRLEWWAGRCHGRTSGVLGRKGRYKATRKRDLGSTNTQFSSFPIKPFSVDASDAQRSQGCYSMSVRYEPASEPSHISVKELFASRPSRLSYPKTSTLAVPSFRALFGRPEYALGREGVDAHGSELSAV